jgi:hypothetical protein
VATSVSDISFDRFVPHGHGTARYSNNSCYEGEWKNGEFHGRGKFTWADGSSYEGDYENGKKHGQGTFIYPSRKVYRGAFENGKQHGDGTLEDRDGRLLKEGLWQEGRFEIR